jgi:hypothetical protein
MQHQADDGTLPALIDGHERGGVRVLVLWGANLSIDTGRPGVPRRAGEGRAVGVVC